MPLFLPVKLNNVGSSTNDTQPTTTLDGLELIFKRGPFDGSGSDLFVSTRVEAGEDFGLPAEVPGFSSTAAIEAFPELSPDGLELYLNVNNAGIHRTARATRNTPWSTAVPLFDGYGVSLTGDGLTMYYNLSFKVTMRTRGNALAAWSSPTAVELPGLGNNSHDHITVSPDNLHLVLTKPLALGPVALEASRASATATWGSVHEISELTSLPIPPEGCDFGRDADEMYCHIKIGDNVAPGFELFRVVRQ